MVLSCSGIIGIIYQTLVEVISRKGRFVADFIAGTIVWGAMIIEGYDQYTRTSKNPDGFFSSSNCTSCSSSETTTINMPPAQFFITMANGSRLKIVIFGAFGAGKTTLIKSLDPESKHVESRCPGGTTTVALDFGRVELDGHQLHVYGTPGQESLLSCRDPV